MLVFDIDKIFVFFNQNLSYNNTYLFLVLLIMVFLIFLSGLVSGSEVAFFSLNSNDIKKISSSKKKTLKSSVNLLKEPDRLLATILILNNLVNVAIITVSAFFVWTFFGQQTSNNFVFVYLIIIVTLVLVFFGEIIPKVYATRNKFLFINFSYNLIVASKILFYPLVVFLIKIGSFFRGQIKKESYDASIKSIKRALELTTNKNTSVEETNILSGIVNFGSFKVKEIMKSRVDIVGFEKNTPLSKLKKEVLKHGYSRIPIYKKNLDKIVGILYVKDLFPHLNKDDSFNWSALIRPPFYVPENKKIDDLFKDFQEKRVHLALVVDEYGGLSGLITMEDVIEEIVGDIKDEFDAEKEIIYKKLDDKTYVFDGKTSLNDFCKVMETKKTTFDSVKGDSESIGGVLLEIKSKLPSGGEKIRFNNFVFTITSVDNKRIKRVRVFKKN